MEFFAKQRNIDAIQYKGNIQEIVSFIGLSICEREQFVNGDWIKSFELDTPIGKMKVTENDWITKENGKIFALNNYWFEMLYLPMPQPEKCACGKGYRSGGNICWECFNKEQKAKEMEDFEKANKIKPENYNGEVLDLSGSYVTHISLYIQEYEENFKEDFPKWIWARKSGPVLSCDILNMIENECNDDGYEDMYENLDTSDDKLIEAQELVDKWIEEQGNRAHVYDEDRKTAIDLSEIYERCLKKLV